MEGYCILSLEKVHSMGSLQQRHKHNFREMNLKHIDLDLSRENEELINDSGLDYKDLWYQRIKDIEMKNGQPISVRKNAVLAYEVIMSFSRDSDVDIDAWKRANKEWLFATFGEENVISATLHMDETTPHIHAVVVPIDERNKLCAKSFTGGRGKMFSLQTEYGKAMKPLGLQRGEMYSRSKKEDLNRFYSLLNKAVDTKAPTIEEHEQIDSYIKRVNTYIQDMQMENMWIKNNSKKALNTEQAKDAQFRAHYSEAIKLQDDLEDSFGDMEFVRQRLQTYRKIECAVPRKKLALLYEGLLEKFPIAENLLNNFILRRSHKQKHKKYKYIDNSDINL